MDAPNPFACLDYRVFLKSALAARRLSLRNLSLRAGIKSTGYFSWVLQGKRTLSEDLTFKVAEVLKLNAKEKEYFIRLVRFNQASSAQAKERGLEKLMELRKSGKFASLDLTQYEFYRKWYHSAIRELVTLPGFREDAAWISKKLKPAISVIEARESLKLLKELGMLKYDKNGRLVQSEPLIWQSADGGPVHAEAQKLMVRSFHSRMMGLGQESLERFPPALREVSSLTLAGSKEAYDSIKDKIVEFEKQILEFAGNDKKPSQKICQLNFQLFPLVTEGEKENP